MKGKIHYTYHIELAEWTGIVDSPRRRKGLCIARLRDGDEAVNFMMSPSQAAELAHCQGPVCLLLETVTANSIARRRLIKIEAYYG